MFGRIIPLVSLMACPVPTSVKAALSNVLTEIAKQSFQNNENEIVNVVCFIKNLFTEY